MQQFLVANGVCHACIFLPQKSGIVCYKDCLYYTVKQPHVILKTKDQVI